MVGAVANRLSQPPRDGERFSLDTPGFFFCLFVSSFRPCSDPIPIIPVPGPLRSTQYMLVEYKIPWVWGLKISFLAAKRSRF